MKATFVIEDEIGLQQHPAPDVVATTDDWIVTQRSQPLRWKNLRRAVFCIEAQAGAGSFLVEECVLSR